MRTGWINSGLLCRISSAFRIAGEVTGRDGLVNALKTRCSFPSGACVTSLNTLTSSRFGPPASAMGSSQDVASTPLIDPIAEAGGPNRLLVRVFKDVTQA